MLVLYEVRGARGGTLSIPTPPPPFPHLGAFVGVPHVGWHEEVGGGRARELGLARAQKEAHTPCSPPTPLPHLLELAWGRESLWGLKGF